MGGFKAVLTAAVCASALCLPTATEAVAPASASTGPSEPGAPAATPRPVLDARAARSPRVVFAGRTKARAVVRLQERRTSSWRTVAQRRATKTGRFRIVLTRPAKATTYRVKAAGRVGPQRQVAPAAAAAPRTPAPTPAPQVTAQGPSDACGPRPKRAEGGYYACTFRDDFDGTALDRSRWMVQETSFSGMYGGSDGCYVDNDRTVRVDGGLLRLTSTILPEPFVCASPYGSFTTRAEVSTVATRSRFTQTYGRFEARLRFPAESGIAGSHAAFWLYPQEHTYGAWPHSGEIDVAEWFSGLPANVYPSVHYAGENTALSSGYNCAMPTASSAFHDYAVEWTPKVMRFYYDGRLCYTHAWTPSDRKAPQPFDQPFYLVLTQVWGMSWNSRSAAMPDTSTLLVDWVKAWS